MEASIIASVVTGAGAAITVIGTTYTTVRSSRDKKDRSADRRKTEAEKEDIVDETRSRLLKDIRDELATAKSEAKASAAEADKYRKEAMALRDSLMEKNSQIDAQLRLIRKLTARGERLTRRAEALEKWIDANSSRFKELGIEGLPFDIYDDRKKVYDDDDDNVDES